MFASFLRQVEERTDVLLQYLSVCRAFDEAARTPSSALHAELSKFVSWDSESAEERILRHCTVITQLYAVYETFSEAAVSHWLTVLPRYRRFAQLPETIKNRYRLGIAQILKSFNARRLRHLDEVTVIKTYLGSLNDDENWQFVEEGFTTHENNLRRQSFEEMFSAAGLTGVWAALERHPELATLRTEDEQNRSLEQLVRLLVDLRNDAAHGRPDEILGLDSLHGWVRFVLAFCQALASVVTHRIVQEEVAARPDCVWGSVTERYSNNIIVAVMVHGQIRPGDILYFLRSNDCMSATVLSLQLAGEDRARVDVQQDGMEVGIRTSHAVPAKAKIISMSR